MTSASLLEETPSPTSNAVLRPPTQQWWQRRDILVAVVGYVVFAILVLVRTPALLEPDDFAYRASIAALSHGHILLTNAQYVALKHSLGGQGIMQWHHLASGKWISEKNPGYPFVAVAFYALHALRLAPLLCGALAAVSLFLAATKWLGRPAGAVAVWLYCFSGAALTFAWRSTMPSFTDASLIAVGFSLLLWTGLSTDASSRRRGLVGLEGLVALEVAVFIRYTNVVELVIAVLATFLLGRRVRIKWSVLAGWASSLVLFGAVVLGFNTWAYGHATSTGYSAGEITFSFSALWPNLQGMPRYQTSSMPLWLPAAAGVVWIAFRWWWGRRDPASSDVRRDAVIGGVLALGWLALWFLYLNYTWTSSMVSGGNGGGPGGGGITVHVIRFYLPALGLVALLATWFTMQLRHWWRVGLLAALVIAALLSFQSMASSGSLGSGPMNGGSLQQPGGAHAGTPPSGQRPTGSPPAGGLPGAGRPTGSPPNGPPPGGGFSTAG